MIEAEVDISGLNSLLSGISNALEGTGGDGDLATVTKQQARLLAVEISNFEGPKTQEKGEKAILKSVKKFITPDITTFSPTQIGGDPAYAYVSAGPNFLVSVKADDYMPNSSTSEVYKAMRDRQDANPDGTGNKFTDIGKVRKTGQHIIWLDRIVSSKTAFASIINKLNARVGRRRATFAEAANTIDPGMSHFPQWITRHFNTQPDRVIADTTGLQNTKSPSVDFGSRAPGITDDSSLEQIRRAVKSRAKKMLVRLDRVLAGYADDSHAGRKIRKHGKDSHE